MFRLNFVLLAILLIIGCFALTSQGESTELYNAENSLTEGVEAAAFETRTEEVKVKRCAPPPKGSTPAPTPATPAPTTRPPTSPTTRATPAPTASPTSRPTVGPTPSPTSRPPTSPTTRATPAPTTAPTSSGSSGSPVGLCDVVPTSQEPVKLLVPLYVYPGKDWDTVIAAASKAKIVAIVNPNSGPLATGPDSSYVSYMNKLKTAGVEMVGYVYTSYGARPIADVKADIDTYKTKYPGIAGIFFDEASAEASDIAFYTQAYNHVISKGWAHSILNPGIQPAQGYLAISSNIVIFENAGSSASKSTYASWVKCASSASAKSGYKYKFSGIAHTAATASHSSIISSFVSQGMGMVYVTDGAGGCCTYNTLTSYFATEASSVASLN